MKTRRSVGGAARGPITPSPSSSLGVSIPYKPTTKIPQLRAWLSALDRAHEMFRRNIGWNPHAAKRAAELDEERRMIRERIKALSLTKKRDSQQ